MSAVAVITPPTLDELAATILREHDLVVEAGTSAVAHAILAGHALVEVRRTLPYSQWRQWIDENVRVCSSVASTYMRLSHYSREIGDAKTIIEAITNLRGRPDFLPSPPILKADKSQMRELRAAGATYSEIGSALGISRTTVEHHLRTPEQTRRKNDAQRERQRVRAAEKKALKRQQRDAAMKKAGGDAWDAYLLVRKLAPLLESLKLNSAYHKCASIEDDLVKAVKTST